MFESLKFGLMCVVQVQSFQLYYIHQQRCLYTQKKRIMANNQESGLCCDTVLLCFGLYKTRLFIQLPPLLLSHFRKYTGCIIECEYLFLSFIVSVQQRTPSEKVRNVSSASQVHQDCKASHLIELMNFNNVAILMSVI